MPTASDVQAIVQAWYEELDSMQQAVGLIGSIGAVYEDDKNDPDAIEKIIDEMPGHLRTLRQHALRVRSLYDEDSGE